MIVCTDNPEIYLFLFLRLFNITKSICLKASLSLHLKLDYCNPVTSVAPQLLVSMLSQSCSASITLDINFLRAMCWLLVFSDVRCCVFMRCWGHILQQHNLVFHLVLLFPYWFHYTSLHFHSSVHQQRKTNNMGIFVYHSFTKHGAGEGGVKHWSLLLKLFELLKQ